VSFEQVGAADIAGNGAHVLVVRQLHVALGAAAAPYYGYGGDPCLRQQQVVDAWGNAQWTYVRVC
jgi:hypothetical protein